MQPHIFVIAGPNGAGKTTASPDLLKKHLHVFEYVNADEIARGLNPLKPETADSMAARIALERLRMLARKKENFAFETTLSGQTLAAFPGDCIRGGYLVTLAFLWLPSAELAVARVRNRIKQGGHAIHDDVIRRRFHKGLANLYNIYLPLCQSGIVLDSARPAKKGAFRPKIAEKLDGRVIIYDNIIWDAISKEAKNG